MQADPTAPANPNEPGERHYVVCGDTPLAYRLILELTNQYDGKVCAILPDENADWAPHIIAIPDLDVVVARRLDEDAFNRAQLGRAAAVALLSPDDSKNVDAALLAQELHPQLRVVLRMSNPGLGEHMRALLNNCAVLSRSAIAAPAFVAAALGQSRSAPIQIGDRTLVATRRDRARPEDVMLGLAITTSGEPQTLPPPGHDDQTDVVLATTTPAPPPARRRRPKRAQTLRLLPLIFGTRLWLVVLVLAALFIAGTAALAVARSTSLGQAAYMALLAELGGAEADPTANTIERITLSMLTFVSIAVIPVVTVAVVDGAVKARLRLEADMTPAAVSGHIVVVGLGNMGSRVIRSLTEQGIEVVAVERDPQARGVAVARELGVPVIIGDATRPETLTAASVATCRCLLVVSSDDVSNLEAALVGREANPDLRVVLRLFDGDFAHRVQRAFTINASRSVSYLAAPAFAAAMLGRQVIATIPIRRRVLLVAELPVEAGSQIENRTVAEVTRPYSTRLLAVRDSAVDELDWLPAPDRRLARGDRAVVLATRVGLGDLVAQFQAGEPPAPVPLPAQPGADQDLSERPGRVRPIGPQDAGMAGPA